MIGLLPKLLQQVKYKGVDTLEEVIRIAEKKKVSLESTPIIPSKDTADIQHTSLQTSSSTSTLHPSNMLSRIKADMEQLVSQMTQVSVHLFQPRTFRNTERYSNKVQCYACKWATFQEIVRIEMQWKVLHQDELLLRMTKVRVVWI